MNKRKICLNCIMGIMILLFSFIQLEISQNADNIFQFMRMKNLYKALNLFTIMSIIIIFTVILRKYWLATLFYSLLSFIISIVNYYMVQFHGMPLSYLELKNFSTAMNVIDIAAFQIDMRIILFSILFIINIVLSFFIKSQEVKLSFKCKVWLHIVGVVTICSVLFWGYLSNHSIKPHKTITWSWQEGYYHYGYVACTIESVLQSSNVVEKPEGYSIDKVKALKLEQQNVKQIEIKPDIILILNESFFDLRQIADIKTNISYMDYIDNLKSIKGYAIVPGVGGMTNSSEYELLTSNSLQLMKGITPFNVLDLHNANSIVSVLEQSGYYTYGMHPCPGLNYSRERGYLELGFDEIYFKEDFQHLRELESRPFETDKSCYENLIRWYEENDSDGTPKFMYMLTIQNHADWYYNSQDENEVQVLNDFGEKTDMVSEYLTCMKESNEALEMLLEYFSSVDRPVIVCMVGDHCPYLAEDVIKESYSEEEKKLLLRAAPFVIWSNYGNIDYQNMGYVSLSYLSPILLDVAGVNMSPYYQYILSLKNEVPVITGYNTYFDKEGKVHMYTEQTHYSQIVNDYFALEYNNIDSPNRIQEYFECR